MLALILKPEATSWDTTPWAVYPDYLPVIELLLERGAGFYTKDPLGQMAPSVMEISHMLHIVKLPQRRDRACGLEK